MVQLSKNLFFNTNNINIFIKKYFSDIELLEKKYKNNNIDEKEIFNIIKNNTIKYENIIVRDQKIKKKKVGEYLDNLNNEIFDNLINEINNDNIDLEKFAKNINKIIYPKGIWAENILNNGKKFLKFNNSGEFRKNKELISVGGEGYFFIEPEQIHTAVKSLQEYINSSPKNIIEIYFIIFYFLNIHPLIDGNGVVSKFLFIVLMNKNGYSINNIEDRKIFADEKGLFYKRNNLNEEKVIKNIINFYKQKNEI